MKDKVVLSESFYIKGFISKSLDLDKFYIKNNIIKNYAYDSQLTKDKLYPSKDYINLSQDENVLRLNQYFVDFYKLYHRENIEIMHNYGIFLNQNQSINLHNHINDYDLTNSPEISVLYVVDCNDDSLDVEFQFHKRLTRNSKKMVTLKQNDYLVFNSNLQHGILANKNNKPILLLSFQFRVRSDQI